MNSRMERYYSASEKTSKRSEKNKELYRDIYDASEYSNIEAVATLDKTNEIDITKIKKMLTSREDYKKQREYQSIIKSGVVEEKKPVEREIQPIKSYDIKDELEKIATTKENSEHRTLDDTSYRVLKQLKIKKDLENQPQEEKDELQDMIDAITNTSLLNKLDNEELSLNMFEDLASSGQTTVNGKTSITALLEEAKKIDEKNQRENEKIDNSFYTSSLNIDSKDFEEFYDKNVSKKKVNPRIKIVVGLILLVTIVLIGVMIFKFLH